MSEKPFSPPERAMVIVAHPDDAEYTMAGTAAKWARMGSEVYYLICTDGRSGSNDPAMLPDRLVGIRRKEQSAAGKLLGVREAVFLDHCDGTLQPTLDLRRDITRELRRYRPDAVLCADPTVRFHDGFLNHPERGLSLQLLLFFSLCFF